MNPTIAIHGHAIAARELARRHLRVAGATLGLILATLIALLLDAGVRGVQAELAMAAAAPSPIEIEQSRAAGLPKAWVWQRRAVDFDAMYWREAAVRPDGYVMDPARRTRHLRVD